MFEIGEINISFEISVVIVTYITIYVKLGKMDRRLRKLENGNMPEKPRKGVLKAIHDLVCMLLSK
jgi:hypothetical protein